MIIACLAVTTIFSGCNDKENPKDDDLATSTVKTITAQVEGGSNLNSKIDEVRAFADYLSGSSWIDEEIAKGSFANGGFTITLPDNLADKFLEVCNFPEGINVSDKTVKRTEEVWFLAYKGGEPVGRFWYESDNSEAMPVFVDGNVEITGTVSEKDIDGTWNRTYSLSLKTGWNLIYFTYSYDESSKIGTTTTTTKDPGGLKWFFEEYEDY